MTESEYPALVVSPRSGTELFHDNQTPLGFDLLGFWRWAASDLVGNTLRGVLAEYLVARALGIATGTRTEWDSCDLRTADGTGIEVKSAAYLQSWSQREHSAISFDIAPKRGWDAATNTYAPAPCRSADVYVFALLAHREKSTLDPLDVSQWRFYVVSARRLDLEFTLQRRLGLAALGRLSNAHVYGELSDAVGAIAATRDLRDTP